MEVRFHSLALIFFAALAGFAQPAFAMRITVVEIPQNRDQTETQQGLSPEKKRSLSKYGPEDVFSEQEMNDPRQSESRRKPQSAPGSNPSSAPKQSPSAAATPSPQPVASEPVPTINVAALDNQGRQPPLVQMPPPAQEVSRLTVPILSVMALVVFAALLYVLNKLRGLLRASS
ncbi:MAG TPA: hypothetical protein VJ810_27170 [Blastocatellia bacterium]|nr:hypothetical protein [Blastocatellia bacterium]